MNSHVVMSAKGGDRQACASPSQRWCVAPVKFYRRSSPAVLHRGPAASSCSGIARRPEISILAPRLVLLSPP